MFQDPCEILPEFHGVLETLHGRGKAGSRKVPQKHQQNVAGCQSKPLPDSEYQVDQAETSQILLVLGAHGKDAGGQVGCDVSGFQYHADATNSGEAPRESDVRR